MFCQIKRRLISISGMLVVLCLAASCKKGQEQVAIPPTKVTVVKAIKMDVPIYEDFIAQAYGLSDVDIRSRVEGWITAVSFKEGSSVRKGTLLYTIDDNPYKTKVDEVAAELSRAEAERVRAQNELSRVRPLAEQNALSKKDLDNAIASFEAATAQVRAYQSSLENAKIEYGYTRIYAPFDGVIGTSNARVGDYVKGIGASSVLTTISDIKTMRVRFQLSEREYLRIARLPAADLENIQTLQLILADETVYPQSGKVNFAAREIDPKTGTMTIEAIFPNPSGLLRPGLFVKVRALTSTYKDAVVVPQRAVFQLQSLFQLFTVTDSSTLKVTVIETGPLSGESRVVTKGIKEGDKIAIVGNSALTPNARIEEVPEEWPKKDSDQK